MMKVREGGNPKFLTSTARSDLLRQTQYVKIGITDHNYLLGLDKRTLSIQWEISSCGEYRLSTYQPSEYFEASDGVWTV